MGLFFPSVAFFAVPVFPRRGEGGRIFNHKSMISGKKSSTSRDNRRFYSCWQIAYTHKAGLTERYFIWFEQPPDLSRVSDRWIPAPRPEEPVGASACKHTTDAGHFFSFSSGFSSSAQSSKGEKTKIKNKPNPSGSFMCSRGSKAQSENTLPSVCATHVPSAVIMSIISPVFCS